MSISLKIPTSESMSMDNPSEAIIITLSDIGGYTFDEKEHSAQIVSDPDSTKEGEEFCFYLSKKDIIKMAKRILSMYRVLDEDN